MEYQRLRVYSYYDFLNSTIEPKTFLRELVSKKEEFAPFVGNKNVFGLVSFALRAREKGLKPVLGLSLGLVQFESIPICVTVFAKNFLGLQNIFRLSTRINSNSEKLSSKDLEGLKEGLIFVIHFDFPIDKNRMKQLLKDLKSLSVSYFFGAASKDLILSSITDLVDPKLVIPFFSIRRLQSKEKSLLLTIRQIQREETEPEDEVAFFEDLTPEEKIFDSFFGNERELLKQIDFELIKEIKKSESSVVFESEKKDQKRLLELCKSELKRRFPGNKKYEKRFLHELDIISRKKIIGYFLIVWDYVNFAKKKNILIGPGRGSAAGSLISFLLGITRIDPIANNLIFERFLNEKRSILPDIDIDFEDSRREEVINYLFQKYETNRVTLVSTFQRIRPKLAIRDLGRVMKIPLSEVDMISKNLPDKIELSLSKTVEKSLPLQRFKAKYPELFELAECMIGFPRQPGTHASGVVLSSFSFRDFFGVWKNNDRENVQLDMNELPEFGLIKMDLLGLRNLTLISQVFDLNEFREDKNAYFDRIDFFDKGVFEELSRGKTKGIFQLESPGMTRLIKNIKPKNIEDIAIAISLFRPGPMKNIQSFLKQRESNKIDYLIPDFKPILENTFGVPIYQEQIIKMINIYADISYSDSELFRRAISKKDASLLESFRKNFFLKAIEKGRSVSLTEQVWSLLEKFGNYGFNRSHALAYAYISYTMAYLKNNFFFDFMNTLLNAWIGDKEKISQYLLVFREREKKIFLPSVNGALNSFEKCENGVQIPLLMIKNVGSKIVSNFVRERSENGAFRNLFDFFVRFIVIGGNEKIYKQLVFSGALDSLQNSRTALIKNWVRLKIVADTVIVNKKEINWTLLPEENFPVIKSLKGDQDEIWSQERDALGLSLRQRPKLLEFIKEKLSASDKKRIVSLEKIRNEQINRAFKAIFFIVSIREIKTNKGDKMAYIGVSNGDNNLDLTVFPEIWNRRKLDIDSFLFAEIRIDFYKGKRNFILKQIF